MIFLGAVMNCSTICIIGDVGICFRLLVYAPYLATDETISTADYLYADYYYII